MPISIEASQAGSSSLIGSAHARGWILRRVTRLAEQLGFTEGEPLAPELNRYGD